MVKDCQKTHHTHLRPPSVPLQPSDSPAPTNNETLKNSLQLQISNQSIQNKAQLFLQIVPITLIGNSCCLETNALLDSGLDATLIHKV